MRQTRQPHDLPNRLLLTEIHPLDHANHGHGDDSFSPAQERGRVGETPGSILGWHYASKWVSFRSTSTRFGHHTRAPHRGRATPGHRAQHHHPQDPGTGPAGLTVSGAAAQRQLRRKRFRSDRGAAEQRNTVVGFLPKPLHLVTSGPNLSVREFVVGELGLLPPSIPPEEEHQAGAVKLPSLSCCSAACRRRNMTSNSIGAPINIGAIVA